MVNCDRFIHIVFPDHQDELINTSNEWRHIEKGAALLKGRRMIEISPPEQSFMHNKGDIERTYP